MGLFTYLSFWERPDINCTNLMLISFQAEGTALKPDVEE
jgi:hypothetical protein